LQIIKDNEVIGSIEIASKTIFIDKPKLQNDQEAILFFHAIRREEIGGAGMLRLGRANGLHRHF